MFYIYIIYSPKLNKYYTGSTNDLNRRLQDHNRGKTAFAKIGMPWELKYFETYSINKKKITWNWKSMFVKFEFIYKKKCGLNYYILDVLNIYHHKKNIFF